MDFVVVAMWALPLLLAAVGTPATRWLAAMAVRLGQERRAGRWAVQGEALRGVVRGGGASPATMLQPEGTLGEKRKLEPADEEPQTCVGVQLARPQRECRRCQGKVLGWGAAS